MYIIIEQNKERLMLSPASYQTMKYAVEQHADDFWQPQPEGEHNIFLLEDVEAALFKEGYELVLRKKE